MSPHPQHDPAQPVDDGTLARLLVGLRDLRDGNFRRRFAVPGDGPASEILAVFNELADRNQYLESEIARVTGIEPPGNHRPAGQVPEPALTGSWRGQVDALQHLPGMGEVNAGRAEFTEQLREIAHVATAVAEGDLSRKIEVEAHGELLSLKNTINTMVDQLSAFASEVTRVAREVGTEGRLGGQAHVHGVGGTWRDLTDNVNVMADNLTSQVRGIATVASAVAGGDLSKKITVEAKGEVAALAGTINGMVETLGEFADQVTAVAREVGTDGTLGGQARVPMAAGIWRDLTDNVNVMAGNLTNQVRNIAQVTTAVAQGDLSKKIDVDARGEILELKNTINTMVDQLSAFASEVTRVAREVGTEGNLGGQAEVGDISGTWQRLTESVNHLAGNLTTQVRAIATVATAVTAGDLSQQITVDAYGEVAELKNNINAMIGNLRETTRTNREQDWLKTNAGRISMRMHGQHDLDGLASLLMSELAPVVSARCGAFFVATTGDDGKIVLERAAGYGSPPEDRDAPPVRFRENESLVGQAAVERKSIVLTGAPPEYLRISSGLGSTAPVNVAVVPVLFEGEVLGVIELAAVHEFTGVELDLLDSLRERIGVDVNTVLANSRTKAALTESQHLTRELQARSEQLEHQQDELQRSNAELADKAALLASRNRDIELKNIEIEQARQELEDRARELAAASTYKSEFLANMSHELRTPLNSALILAKLLADNLEGNLTPQQVDLAKTIHAAGTDLLRLINDVLDLSKVEAGRMNVLAEEVDIRELTRHLESLYQPIVSEKGLEFTVSMSPSLSPALITDRSRLEQIVQNLLSNAVKFTDAGGIELRIRPAEKDELRDPVHRQGHYLAFVVHDTGIGIPAEKLAHIFEAFQQADGTTVRKYGGTGLGLSISNELSALLGGELQVHSDPGEGSAFTLYLPAEAVEAPVSPDEEVTPESPARQDAPTSVSGREQSTVEANIDVSAEGIDPPLWSSERPAAGQESAIESLAEVGPELAPDPDAVVEPDIPAQSEFPDNSGRLTGTDVSGEAEVPAQSEGHASTQVPRFDGTKVLIVDDDARSVFALTTVLEQHGLEVIHADNGVAGIRTLQEHDDVAMVLMDVMMPELDGNATIRTIREIPRYRDLPIIAVTAKAMRGDFELSFTAGATDYLTKPVDLGALFRLLSVHRTTPADSEGPYRF